MKVAPLLSIAFALAACGGTTDDVPLASAQAAAVAPPPPATTPPEIARFDFILRPDATGAWYIQGASTPDPDHYPTGVTGVVGFDELRNQLVVNFDRRYTHAGVVQITADDDFVKRGIRAGCGLGLTGANCTVTVRDQEIDPRRILDYATPGSGNFWVSVVMVNKR